MAEMTLIPGEREAVAGALVHFALGTFEAPFREDAARPRPLNPPFTPNSTAYQAADAAIAASRAAIEAAGYVVISAAERDDARAEIAEQQIEISELANKVGPAAERNGELRGQVRELEARLSAAVFQQDGDKEPCLICGKPCSALAGNPSLWPLRVGNEGWHHTGCVSEALEELERLRAAIAAAIDLADKLVHLHGQAYLDAIASAIDHPKEGADR